MTTLENFYFGNINPSEYKQSKDTKKKLSEMTSLLDELRSTLTTEQQKEIFDKFKDCQSELCDITARQAGSVGGQMVKKMIEKYENDLKNGSR